MPGKDTHCFNFIFKAVWKLWSYGETQEARHFFCSKRNAIENNYLKQKPNQRHRTTITTQ